jgi:predicted RNase H-like HicB family nuclease
MSLMVETEQEEDGRWIAEFPQLPSALCYGSTKQEALDKVTALALRILADRIEHGEDIPAPFDKMLHIPA